MTTTAAIITGLRDGQGVEDIAVALTMPPDEVRAVVRKLRRLGLLAGVCAESRERARG